MNRARFWALGLSTFLLAACAGVTSLEGERMRMGSDRFAAYVESVFREQNAVATELAFALDAERIDDPRYAILEEAERRLIDACAGLNELAVRHRDGRAYRGLASAGAARRAPECERATRDAEAALRGQSPVSSAAGGLRLPDAADSRARRGSRY